MNKKETTAFLGQLLESSRLSGIGKYWAKEVSIDPWGAKGTPKRVDYMQFVPNDQCSISAIEKGIFVCYEIKSCKEDVYSGSGLNFLGEKNYIVTTLECYKAILPDINSGKLWNYIQEHCPESSLYFGVMVAVPYMSSASDEFENPTPLDSERGRWKLEIIYSCRPGGRKKSMTELLFCMLRSGH